MTTYEQRIRALEAEGMTTSDAQAVILAAETSPTKDRAIASAKRCRAWQPYRIHFIYCLPEQGYGWYSGNSKTMRQPNNLAKKGAYVELLK